MPIDYPAGLPIPQTSVITPLERRAMSDPEMPREARAQSRDRLQFERATWVLTDLQVELFRSWWETDLRNGGAWFNAVFPVPEGLVEKQHCFRTQPSFGFIPGGFWKVSAILEVRGRGRPVEPGLPSTAPPSTPWNSTNEVGTVVFTDDDFTATFSSSATVASLDAGEGSLGDGKYYAELVPSFVTYEGGAAAVQLGVSRANPGSGSDGAAIDLNGDVIVDGATVDNLGAIASGDVVMIALDAFSNFIYFGKNGTWLGGADPAAGTGGIEITGLTADFWLSFFGDNVEETYSCAIRTGTDRFSYSVPIGFTAWNVEGA